MGEVSFNLACRGVWAFHQLRPAVTCSSGSQPAEQRHSAATLKQLLIKCLAQGHPRVIGSRLHHTHTHVFQILLLCNSSSRVQMFFSQSNVKSETTRAQKGARTLHHCCCYATQHLRSDLISIRWVTKEILLIMKTKEKNSCWLVCSWKRRWILTVEPFDSLVQLVKLGIVTLMRG